MYLFSLLSAASVLETVTPVCKWLTVSLLVTTVLLGALLFFVKRSAFLPFVRFALFGVVLYLIALAILFFALDIGKNYGEANGSLVKLLLAPVLCLACVCFLSLIAIAVVKKRCPNKQKTVYYVCGTLFFTALAVCFVCLTVYYNQNIKNDGYYNSDTASVKQLALYISAILCVGVVVALAFTDKRKIDFDSRSVAYAGICSAMSFALSYIKLWDMPQGGSVTLVSLLPVMLYGYIFGAKKGVFVGLCYGLLQAVQDPWIIHPAQMLLDYPVAFSAVGLAGLFRNLPLRKKLPQIVFSLGALVGGIFRFVCHTLSGALAFEAYAGSQNAFVYSLLYNSYVFIDIALVIVAGVFVLSSRSFVKAIETLGGKTTTNQETQS